MPDLDYSALRNYLLHADERAVFRALPRHIAAQLNEAPRPVLEMLVRATFNGDAVLHWEIQCPACGHRREETDWLRHACHDYTCPACDETFTPRLDGNVQVTFSPHPRLRSLGPQANDPEFRQTIRERFPPTTVHELMTVQAFRDWARDETLPAGEYLEVQRIAFWFSDLTGSTALYARQGDPWAYHLVREHFEVVFRAIHQAEGAVVKTMGDGVMAVFVSARQAVLAALSAHRALDDFNRDHALSDDQKLALQVGIHLGPAIVVTLNDRLDYFGTTVNVAARVSDLARGGETVFTQAVLAEPGVEAMVHEHLAGSFQTPVRGLGQAITGYRLRV